MVAYIGDILQATKRFIEKHRRQVGKLFDLLLENKMYVEINTGVYKCKKTAMLGFIISGELIKMYLGKRQDILNWLRPKDRKVTQQILG